MPEGAALIAHATRAAGVNLPKRDPLKAPENGHMQCHPFLSLTDAKLAADRAKWRKSRGDTASPRLFPGVSDEVACLWAAWSRATKFSLRSARCQMLRQVEKVAPSRAPQWEVAHGAAHDLSAATW